MSTLAVVLIVLLFVAVIWGGYSYVGPRSYGPGISIGPVAFILLLILLLWLLGGLR